MKTAPHGKKELGRAPKIFHVLIVHVTQSAHVITQSTQDKVLK